VRNWLRLIALLYPRRWRQRYGKEFDVLLADVRPRWRDGVDVLQGALEMHMKMSNFPKLAVVCGVTGAIVAAAVAFSMPDKYMSEALLSVVSADEQGPLYFRDRVLPRVLSRTSLAELIRKENLYPADRRRMGLEDVVERMRHDIVLKFSRSATGDPGNFALAVRFIYNDPVQAQRTSNELTANLVEANLLEAIQKRKAMDNGNGERQAAGITTIRLLGPATLPRKPVRPNRLVITELGIAVGLVLAVVAAMAMRLRTPAAQT
jgi:hypothetical protein